MGALDYQVGTLLTRLNSSVRYRLSPAERGKKVETILNEECQKGGVELEELRMGSRRGKIPQVGATVAKQLVKNLRMSLAEVARLLGVSTSAISRNMQTNSQQKKK